jgi:predicted 3-demethylubiquinone-9 3-methyltransferase (glyoxalase superfamily)
MTRFLLFGTIAIALTTSCEHSNHSIQDTNSTNQSTIMSDTSKTNHAGIFQKITPSLWIENTDAKSAAEYYLSIFKDGKLKDHRRYKNSPEAGGGEFETAIIEINGVEFNILAAGPFFKFNESVSFVINCLDQAEVDYYWNALTANGGEESNCGWCKDKYGLSWQVVPLEYYDLINSDDPLVREKAMKHTMMQKKLILSELK